MQASTQLVIFFVWTISKLLKFTDRMTLVKANNKTTRFVFVSFVNINRIPSQDWFWVSTFGILYTGLFLPLVYFIFTTFANNFTHLKFARMHLLKEIYCNIRILQVLNSPADNETKIKRETGGIFPCIQYLWHFKHFYHP